MVLDVAYCYVRVYLSRAMGSPEFQLLILLPNLFCFVIQRRKQLKIDVAAGFN